MIKNWHESGNTAAYYTKRTGTKTMWVEMFPLVISDKESLKERLLTEEFNEWYMTGPTFRQYLVLTPKGESVPYSDMIVCRYIREADQDILLIDLDTSEEDLDACEFSLNHFFGARSNDPERPPVTGFTIHDMKDKTPLASQEKFIDARPDGCNILQIARNSDGGLTPIISARISIRNGKLIQMLMGTENIDIEFIESPAGRQYFILLDGDGNNHTAMIWRYIREPGDRLVFLDMEKEDQAAIPFVADTFLK